MNQEHFQEQVLQRLTVLEIELKNIAKDQSGFVTQSEFQPVKRLVYGAVGAILTAVLLGLMALVLQ